MGAACSCCGKKSAAVVPVNDVSPQKTGAGPQPDTNALTAVTPAAAPPAPAAAVPPPAPPVQQPAAPPPATDPARPLPGIMLAPGAPDFYGPLMSNPRLPIDPPYERLVLVSSRVHLPELVARAALPNVAHVVYDWKNCTLQELLRFIKKVLGAQKVTSIAVVAPGSKPGGVGLLEGASTTADKLRAKSELSQFWRVLAGCVSLSGTADGRRVDLLGCRVVEAPREGAELLRELWSLTTVPFAAADDALAGYMLCTFMEEPVTKQLGLISSNIPAIDLYFNRHALLRIPPPGRGDAAPKQDVLSHGQSPNYPPLPPVSPPPDAFTPKGSVPQLTTSVPQPPTSQPTPGINSHNVQGQLPPQDIFTRLTEALERQGKKPVDAFVDFDKDGNGQLSPAELTALLKYYVPDATPVEEKHFQFMVDADALPNAKDEFKVTRDDFVTGLSESAEVHRKVQEREDEGDVLQRFMDYLTLNEPIIRETFNDFDKDKNDKLDHLELGQLVLCIPALEPRQRKFIMTYVYEYDKNRDGMISFKELKEALKDVDRKPALGIAAGAAAQGATGQAHAVAAGQAQAAVAQAQGAPAGAQAAAQQAQLQAMQAAQQAGQSVAGQAQTVVVQGQAVAAAQSQGAAGQVQAMAWQGQAAGQSAAAGAVQRTQEALGSTAGNLPQVTLAPGVAPFGSPGSQLGQLPGIPGPLAPLGGQPRSGALTPGGLDLHGSVFPR